MYVIQINVVSRAMVVVENNILYLESSTLILWTRDVLTFLSPIPSICESVWPSSIKEANTAMVTPLSRLLNLAIWWRTSMALLSWPLWIRNLGDSWKLKTTKRKMKMIRHMTPWAKSKYRHPMLLALVQQGCPAAILLQAGRGLPSAPSPHEYVGIKP